jgi:hypothetical protein
MVILNDTDKVATELLLPFDHKSTTICIPIIYMIINTCIYLLIPELCHLILSDIVRVLTLEYPLREAQEEARFIKNGITYDRYILTKQ